VLEEDVRVVGGQPGLLDRRAGEEFRVVHEVLVDRRVLGDEHDQRAVALAPHPPGLLPEPGDAARMAGEDAEFEVADVDAQLQGIGRNDGRKPAFGKVAF
jgi:hypothetical protein